MDKAGIYSIFFMIIGIFPIVASVYNWDYFFNNRKAAFFVKLFGRNGARIFYVVLGLGIFMMGFLTIIGVLSFGK